MKPTDGPNQVAKLALVSGGLLCFLAVAVGAFGAHALESILIANSRLEAYETANQYHFYHSIGLLLIGILANTRVRDQNHAPNSFKLLNLVCWLLIVGTVIFSGSLYLLAVTNIKWLGAVTPIGGLLLLSAWLVFVKDMFFADFAR